MESALPKNGSRIVRYLVARGAGQVDGVLVHEVAGSRFAAAMAADVGRPAMAATERKGTIHRATAPATEDITPKTYWLRRNQRQSTTNGDADDGDRRRAEMIGSSEMLDRQRCELARWLLVRVWLSG